jgi:hypothetical protein
MRRSERIRGRAAEGFGASTVGVCDPELLTCLAREVDHFIIVHPAHLARRHDDVTECDLPPVRRGDVGAVAVAGRDRSLFLSEKIRSLTVVMS